MATVRFATTCDFETGGQPCGARSPEYTAWPSCSQCMLEICPEHQRPGTATNDERNRCVCGACEAE